MRDRNEIQAEIAAVQERLSHHLAELREVLSDKVDVKGKVERRVEDTKLRAADAASRGYERLVDLYEQARRFAREQPLAAVALAGAVTLALVGVFAIRRWLAQLSGSRQRALPAASRVSSSGQPAIWASRR